MPPVASAGGEGGKVEKAMKIMEVCQKGWKNMRDCAKI